MASFTTLLQRRAQNFLDSRNLEDTPLYPGYGTHFSYVYVGTPPQRQSVIIDTGSSITAFPCIGCLQCGMHTDAYWNISKSETAIIPQCPPSNDDRNHPCLISQSYAEGSSWKAFEVVDKLWVGGLTSSMVPDGLSYSADFKFGCQTSETGLFRSQLADGIMGMDMSEASLPFTLFSQGLTNSRMFALCYQSKYGIMTLGGVDPNIISSSSGSIVFAKLTRSTGWFTVRVRDMFLRDPIDQSQQSVGANTGIFNSGKGCIIDSGTTDTYLPSAASNIFRQIFQQITGFSYSNSVKQLTKEQFQRLPDVVVVVESTNGSSIELVMRPSNYAELVGPGHYSFGIYLTESNGMILGANFMTNKNIIFDSQNARVGFVDSLCEYQETPSTLKPTRMPTMGPVPISPNCTGNVENSSRPISPCSATCDDGNALAHVASGGQVWVTYSTSILHPVDCTTHATILMPCHLNCKANHQSIRGPIACPLQAWSVCGNNCSQLRQVQVSSTLPSNDSCEYEWQSRPCRGQACPWVMGACQVSALLEIRENTTYFYLEDMATALGHMLQITPGDMEMSISRSVDTKSVIVAIVVYLSVGDIQAAANISLEMLRPEFVNTLIISMETAAHAFDSSLDFSLSIHEPTFSPTVSPNITSPPQNASSEVGEETLQPDKHVSQVALLLLSTVLMTVGAVLLCCCRGSSVVKNGNDGSLLKPFESMKILRKKRIVGLFGDKTQQSSSPLSSSSSSSSLSARRSRDTGKHAQVELIAAEDASRSLLRHNQDDEDHDTSNDANDSYSDTIVVVTKN